MSHYSHFWEPTFWPPAIYFNYFFHLFNYSYLIETIETIENKLKISTQIQKIKQKLLQTLGHEPNEQRYK